MKVPFNIIQLSAQTIFEQTLWVESFQKAINIAKQSLRGYYFKVSNSSDGQRKKKYFVMHEHAIAFYKDMEHLVAPQTCIHLQASTAVDFVDASEVIVVTDPIAKQRYCSAGGWGRILENVFMQSLFHHVGSPLISKTPREQSPPTVSCIFQNGRRFFS